jgi:CubicO group peptidase (beta-lactamase class C family)
MGWEKTKNLLEDLAAEHAGAPGFAAAVVRGPEVLATRCAGLADISTGRTITSATQFELASVSKQFTAACIRLLIDSNELNLDTSVGSIFRLPRGLETASIRDLLFHTSGIPDYLADGNAAIKDNAQVLEWVRGWAATVPRPRGFLYSNTNYVLLAEIVRRVSGKSLAEFASQRLFFPWGLDSTTFIDTPGKMPELGAVGYRYEQNDGRWCPMPVDSYAVGDGGLWSSLSDMCVWARKTRHACASMDFPQPIPEGGETGPSYGFGLERRFRNGLEIISHAGRWRGYSAELMRVPNLELSLVLLSNSEMLDPTQHCLRLLDSFSA